MGDTARFRLVRSGIYTKLSFTNLVGLSLRRGGIYLTLRDVIII
jgi:hypothetical protein